MASQMKLFPEPAATLSPPVKPHPHVVMGEDGLAYVEGTRVPVARIFRWHKRGVPIATLIARYPVLGPAAVLSALAFGYDNEALVARDIAYLEQALAGGR